MRPLLLAVLATLLLAPAATTSAQEADEPGGVARAIFEAMFLPRASQEAREAGVPEADIRVILEETRRRGLPPGETVVLMEETTTAVRENGPVDNFGAFVQARLAEGLRGQALAAAIHEQHRRQGKGKGHGRPAHAGEGKPDDAGKGKGGGR